MIFRPPVTLARPRRWPAGCQRWSKTEPFRGRQAVTMAQFSTVTDTRHHSDCVRVLDAAGNQPRVSFLVRPGSIAHRRGHQGAPVPPSCWRSGNALMALCSDGRPRHWLGPTFLTSSLLAPDVRPAEHCFGMLQDWPVNHLAVEAEHAISCCCCN